MGEPGGQRCLGDRRRPPAVEGEDSDEPPPLHASFKSRSYGEPLRRGAAPQGQALTMAPVVGLNDHPLLLLAAVLIGLPGRV